MPQFIQSSKSFFVKCRRVWNILKKPSMDEFKKVVKVSAIGILVIGVFGFAISIFVSMFFT